MKLDKVILVNWGALRDREYEMGDMTLFTGPTGSGKSTILDAIQTVMTAAYQNIFNYNPGQDEQSQTARNGKSKRTLWSYIVGAEDNLFARPGGAHGYIAAVFSPDAKDPDTAKSFTAIVAAAARVDGSGDRRVAVQERLGLLIVDDARLVFDDFVETVSPDGSSTTFVAVEHIEAALRRKYKAVTSFRDGKREYLSHLYGRFRGQKTVSFPEAEAAARALTQSIAYRPIGSVDDLVRTQVLEYDPQQLNQRITDISGLMRQVSGLRRDGERLKANVGRLDALSANITKATRAFELSAVASAAAATRAVLDDQQKLQEHADNLERLLLSIDDEAAERRQLLQSRQAYDEQRIRIEATLLGTPVADQHVRIGREIADAHTRAHDIARATVRDVAACRALVAVARSISELDLPQSWGAVRTAALGVAQALRELDESGADLDRLEGEVDTLLASELDVRAALTVVKALDGLGILLGQIYSAVTDPTSGFNVALRTQLGALEAEVAELARRERELATQKESLATGGASYPNEIAFAVKTLKAEIPAAGVQVLCDLVEPAPGSEWHSAIEAYMGRARFSVIVAPDWEERAMALVKERRLRVSVVQGSKVLRQSRERSVLEDSIVHELRCEHPTAKAYLDSQFGAVVKVRDFETLRHTARGVMKDGRAAGANTMYAVEAADLVFGQEARRIKRDKVAAEHQRAEAALGEINRLKQSALATAQLCGKITPATFAGADGLEQTAHDVERARAALATLDLSEVEELHNQKETVAAQIDAIDARVSESDKRSGGHQLHADQCRVAGQRVEGGLPAKQALERTRQSELAKVVELNPALALGTLLGEAQQSAATASIETLHSQARSHEQTLTTCCHKVLQELSDYNQAAQGDERLEAVLEATGVEGSASRYIPLVALRERVAGQLAIQKDIGVVKNLDQLRVAESSFKDVFTKQFCYEIRNAVDSGVKTLQYLNRDLERLKFGTDRFILDWAEWVPEFKEYFDFFKATCELSESKESLDLFAVTELSEENAKVRDKLVALLLSEDQDRALKELQRIADYRNYRRYEIWKESDSGSRIGLSTWGTGSGGQLETPAYIVRAAVVTNRLKNFDRSMSLRLMMNDESFAKTDERRARDIIRFLRDKLGMQLLCAMPTKQAGAIKTEFSKEFSITRLHSPGHGETNLVSDADERTLRSDALRSLWEQRRAQVRDQARIDFEVSERLH
jgi:energy-coupling factor transporter ATP-binding protein EcfA2